jgi:PAS domain S-box-containing protein
MKDSVKTKAQLLNELATLRRRKERLEKSAAKLKLTEKALREIEEHYRTLADISPHSIVVHCDGKIVAVNAAGVRLLGGTNPGQIIGKPILDFVHPDFQEIFKKRIRTVIKDQKKVPFHEQKLIQLDGTVVDVEAATVPFTYQGKPAAQVVAREITERKLVEEALRASEKRFRTLIENSSDALSLISSSGTMLYISPSTNRIFGISSEERLGNNAFERVHPDDLSYIKSQFAQLLKHPGESMIVQVRTLHGDGTWHWTEAMGGNLLKEPSVRAIVVNFRDITARKQAEEALRESVEKYKTLTEHLNVGVYRNTPGPLGKFIEANPAIVRMFGYDSKEEFLAIHVADLYQNPSDREDFSKKVIRDGFVKNEELRLKKKDGTSFVGSASSVAVSAESGRVKYFDGIIDDITERKRAENQIKASLAEKEVLLREIHHRVKNNMQIISSLLNLQAGYIKEKDDLKMIKDSQSRIRSMALIHEQLYKSQDFSRINFSDYVQRLAVHLFQFNQVDPNLIQLKMSLEDAFLDIQTAIPCGLILNELITNSLKHAFPQGRRGEIGLGLHPLKDRTYQMIVRDTGAGLSSDVDVRDPKSFGLQIVTMLVDQLEGKMEVEKEGGTTFKIIFKELKYKSRL